VDSTERRTLRAAGFTSIEMLDSVDGTSIPGGRDFGTQVRHILALDASDEDNSSYMVTLGELQTQGKDDDD